MGVTRGYGRDCWKFARKVLVFKQFWHRFEVLVFRQFWYRFGFRDEDSGGNVDFGTIFLYLIRRVENAQVGWVVIGYDGFGEDEREIKEIYRLFICE